MYELMLSKFMSGCEFHAVQKSEKSDTALFGHLWKKLKYESGWYLMHKPRNCHVCEIMPIE